MSLADDAIEILRLTHDGDDLAPRHLKLVEHGVNGRLNDSGEKAFADLLAQCRVGYKKPWLCDVEHLTIDHEGYVYWKGQHIEHWGPGRLPDPVAEAKELARRCQLLEAAGKKVSCRTVIWDWSESA